MTMLENTAKQLKWEQAFWWLNKRRSSRRTHLEQNFDDDYIVNRGKVPAFMTANGPQCINELDLWTGHTNFLVDEVTFYEAIESTPGIEAGKVLTRYRFEVVIGKLFDGETVRRDFKEKLCNSVKKHWALIQDNNVVKTVKGDSIEEVVEKIQDSKVIKKSWVQSPNSL